MDSCTLLSPGACSELPSTFTCHREQLPCAGDLSVHGGHLALVRCLRGRKLVGEGQRLHSFTRCRAEVQAGLQASSPVQAVSLGSICPVPCWPCLRPPAPRLVLCGSAANCLLPPNMGCQRSAVGFVLGSGLIQPLALEMASVHLPPHPSLTSAAFLCHHVSPTVPALRELARAEPGPPLQLRKAMLLFSVF